MIPGAFAWARGTDSPIDSHHVLHPIVLPRLRRTSRAYRTRKKIARSRSARALTWGSGLVRATENSTVRSAHSGLETARN